MLNWMYKWLPIICGCHCKPDRSFHFKGRPFPVCARCTGFLAGMLLAVFAFAFYHISSVPLLVLMLIPMIADGVVQKRTSYESSNLKRVITGFLFGYAVWTLFIWSLAAVYHLGFDVGMKLKN